MDECLKNGLCCLCMFMLFKFIACCQHLLILLNVVYFVFAAFLLDTLFGSCFIYFSKMFVNWYSKTGGRVEILCL